MSAILAMASPQADSGSAAKRVMALFAKTTEQKPEVRKTDKRLIASTSPFCPSRLGRMGVAIQRRGGYPGWIIQDMRPK